MSDRYDDLPVMLSAAWQLLGRGVADAKSPARHPTLATVGADGRPQMRTVVLRAARQGAAQLEMHSDRRTAKIDALRADPFCALHVWAPRGRLQLRLLADARIVEGDAAADRWQAIPEAARGNYGVTPPPGTEIGAPDGFVRAPDPAAFAAILCDLTEIEVLHLGREAHRRARFLRGDGWAGAWLAP